MFHVKHYLLCGHNSALICDDKENDGTNHVNRDLCNALKRLDEFYLVRMVTSFDKGPGI